jgi:hypothetical protein
VSEPEDDTRIVLVCMYVCVCVCGGGGGGGGSMKKFGATTYLSPKRGEPADVPHAKALGENQLGHGRQSSDVFNPRAPQVEMIHTAKCAHVDDASVGEN